MKRLLAASSIALILIAAPAAANYGTCMKFCTKEYGFAHCHKICTEDMEKMPAANTEIIEDKERMTRNYSHLAGNTYKITSSDDSDIEIMRFDINGHTEYIVRSCFGEGFCEGTTEVKNGMVESKLECHNWDVIYRRFKLEGVSNFENFNVLVYSNQWNDKGINLKHDRIEDPSQVTESGCQ